MNLEFEQIIIQGFKTWRQRTVVDLKAFGTGLHFVRGLNKYKPRLGPNGVGKSALWDALLWCLYGATVQGLRNPDIKPWSGKHEPTSVTVRVFGREITRTASPNSLLLDGEPVGQDKINTLLGIPKDVFCHTILLGQGQLLFLDLKPKDKMDVFNSVLQLDRWDDRAKAASQKAAALQTRVDEINGQLIAEKAALAEIRATIAKTKKMVSEWEAEQQGDDRKQQKELAALKKQIAAKQRIRDDADLAYDSAATEARACEKVVDDLETKLTAAERGLAQKQIEVDASVKERHKLSKERDQMKLDKTCPTCGQTIRNANQLKKHVAELTSKIGRLKLKKEELVQEEIAFANTIKRLEHKLDQQRGFMKEFKAKAETAEAALSLQKTDIADLTTKITVIEELIKRSDQTTNPHKQNLRLLVAMRERKLDAIDELEELHSKLLRRIERVKFWTKGFKEVQLYIVDEVLQELELVTNALLSEMGLDDWEIKYAIEKETKSGTVQRGLNVTVLSPDNNKPVRWECWSGGEGQRLRVLGALALSEVLLNHAGITTNLEVLDEPTRGLSDEGVADLCKYLALRSEQLNKQCWLIDHTAIPSSNFTSTLTVIRDKKGTRLQF